MTVKFLKRSFFQRIFGISATQKPENDDCWSYAGEKLTIDLKKAPELKKQGGALRFEGKNLPFRVLVVYGEDSKYLAYRNRCSHFGRRLDPVPGTATVQCCSVNKSTYDSEGTKIFGPVSKPVAVYPVEAYQDKLIVSLSQ